MDAMPAAPPAESAAAPAIRRDSFSRRLKGGVIAIAQAELRKLRRNPGVVAGRSVNALMWLLVFGTVFGGTLAHVVPGSDYRSYLAPAILAQAGVVIGVSVGLGLIWERDVGQLPRLLATPLPAAALVLGKAVAACAQVLAQAVVVLIVLFAVAGPAHWSMLGSIAALAILMLGTAAFASMAFAFAAIYRDRDRFVAVTQMLMMPLVFVSCALYPLSLMPGLLRVVAEINPLTYEIQAMRELFLGIDQGSALWIDLAVVVAFFLSTVYAAVRLCPRAIR
jgi:ABC-2 type transport system permease protein